jgi:hypothetical protein
MSPVAMGQARTSSRQRYATDIEQAKQEIEMGVSAVHMVRAQDKYSTSNNARSELSVV